MAQDQVEVRSMTFFYSHEQCISSWIGDGQETLILQAPKSELAVLAETSLNIVPRKNRLMDEVRVPQIWSSARAKRNWQARPIMDTFS